MGILVFCLISDLFRTLEYGTQEGEGRFWAFERFAPTRQSVEDEVSRLSYNVLSSILTPATFRDESNRVEESSTEPLINFLVVNDRSTSQRVDSSVA